jgi:glycosyltransferase involved in cell wall biosynthesis
VQERGPSTLRLTMAITELDVGGAERAFVKVACGLKDRGWHVDVVSLRNSGPLSQPLLESGIRVTPLNSRGFLDLSAIPRFQKHLSLQRCQCLLTFLHEANLVGRLAARLSGVPRVVSGIRVADRRWSVRIPESLTQRLVTRYIAVSESVADVHARICRIPRTRFDVITNGVDADQIRSISPVDRSTLGCLPDDFIFLCAGRLSDQKAPLDVLSAFHWLMATVKISERRIRLLFVGDGPLRKQLEQEILNLSLVDAVQVLGWRSDLWSLMKSANCLVLASHWEGLPNVILESQAAGLPVIASAVDGCQELIEDQMTGLLFAPGQADTLASQMEWAIRHRDELKALADHAFDRVTQDRSWSRCIDEYDRVLRSVVDDRPKVEG